MREQQTWRASLALLLATLTLLLAGCGFQLRGTGGPVEAATVLQLKGSGLSLAFDRALRDTFARAGSALVESPATAEGTLEVDAFEETRRVLSYNDAGAVHETELATSVRYRVDGDGEPSAWQPVVVRRDLRIDNVTPAEVAAEERRIRLELLIELAEELRRLVAAAG